mgnify:FL=1
MVKLVLSICFVAAVLLSACSGEKAAEPVRAVCYWSTVLDVDTAKLAFIKAHGIGRM